MGRRERVTRVWNTRHAFVHVTLIFRRFMANETTLLVVRVDILLCLSVVVLYGV